MAFVLPTAINSSFELKFCFLLDITLSENAGAALTYRCILHCGDSCLYSLRKDLAAEKESNIPMNCCRFWWFSTNCYGIKIEHRYNVEIRSQIYFHEKLIIVGFATTCRGRGHNVAAPLQAAQLV